MKNIDSLLYDGGYLYLKIDNNNILKIDKKKNILKYNFKNNILSFKNNISPHYINLTKNVILNSERTILRIINNAKPLIIIKNIDETARVFGYKKLKEKMLNLITDNYILQEYTIKENKSFEGFVIDIYNKETDKYLKFSSNDVELVIPDLKGYNAPKDRTIRVGSVVLCKNNKGYKNLEKNEKVEIMSIIKRDGYTDKPEILLIKDKNDNRFKAYSKDFKVV